MTTPDNITGNEFLKGAPLEPRAEKGVQTPLVLGPEDVLNPDGTVGNPSAVNLPKVAERIFDDNAPTTEQPTIRKD